MGGRVSSLAWFQQVFLFRSVVSSFSSETVMWIYIFWPCFRSLKISGYLCPFAVDLMEIMSGHGCEGKEDHETAEHAQAHDLVAQIEHLEAETPSYKAQGKFTFPFANTIDFYGQLFKSLASVSDTVGLALITSSMHPSPWLSARQHNMSVVVWGPRKSVHAQKHGLALATSARLTNYLAEEKSENQPAVAAS